MTVMARMYWLQRRRKEAGHGEQTATPRQDHPRWLEARVEGEVPKSENIVVDMGSGVRMLVGNRTQTALAGEVLRAMGRSRPAHRRTTPSGPLLVTSEAVRAAVSIIITKNWQE